MCSTSWGDDATTGENDETNALCAPPLLRGVRVMDRGSWERRWGRGRRGVRSKEGSLQSCRSRCWSYVDEMRQHYCQRDSIFPRYYEEMTAFRGATLIIIPKYSPWRKRDASTLPDVDLPRPEDYETEKALFQNLTNLLSNSSPSITDFGIQGFHR